MKKELTSRETVLQIIREVCCSNGSQKKKKRNRGKKIETDIDIFADDDQGRANTC